MASDRITPASSVVRSWARPEWRSVFAGAVCGLGLAFVLDAFGTAIGLAVSSAAPTWRDASIALAILSGLYLILVAIVSYGFGSFVASRMREPAAAAAEEDRELNDGYHGLVVWGLMTLATAVMLLVGAIGLTRASSTSSSTGPAQSSASENIIAFDLDRLFRGARETSNITYQRAEAGRILLTTSSHRGMQQDDRAYLVRLVQTVAGLSPADAEARVKDVSARAKQNIDRARNSSVIIAFMTAAAALLGAVAAWFASAAAGREREGIADIWRSESQWPWQSRTR